MVKRNDDLITVCDSCLCASCWQGIFYCENYKSAGIVKKTKTELIALNRENTSYLKTDEQLWNEARQAARERYETRMARKS